jgi:hypothetical protein
MRFVQAAGAPLVANLAAMWAVDPVLAARLEGELEREPYPVEPSKSGAPTLARSCGEGRRLYLHSRHQPIEEARRLIDAAEGVGQRAVFIIHGFGLGYHVEELFNRSGREALLVVLEPDLRLMRTAFEHRDLSRLIRSRRVLFIFEADRAALIVRLSPHQALVSLGPGVINHAPSLQIEPEFHRRMKEWLGEFESYCQTSINTLVLNGRRTCENIARNLGWYIAAPGVNRLRGRHAGRPAIVVSAGPSLRKNQHLLHDAAGKAVLVAVQTTLQPLLDMGIEPQFAASLDYHDICTRFFERLPSGLRTELVAEPKASAAVLKLYPGPISLLGNELADRMLSPLRLGKARLRAGATVAHLAFYLAEYLGCDPIIFVGQDLGFSDGLAYTPGTSYEDVWRPELGRFCTMEMRQWEHIARERPILRRIADFQGRPMYTEERLFAYLQQFERDFAQSPARIIDATEGGALKRGATPMPLAEAIERFCKAQLPAVPEDHPGLCWGRLPLCVEALSRRVDEAARVGAIGRETLPLLEEIRGHVSDQARVNRLIGGVDGLRARMLELNDCYELVTQLTQQSELQRFRADRELAASGADGLERQRRQIERDIANVQAVIDAAGQFGELMEQVLGQVSANCDGQAMGRAA